jgi:hypothetical protein
VSIGGLGSSSLIVATANLTVVNLLRQAITAGDQAAAAAARPLDGGNSFSADRDIQSSPPCQRPRQLQSAPVAAPAKALHTLPRLTAPPATAPSPSSDHSSAIPHVNRAAPAIPPVFQPPWHVLPWPQHSAPDPRIKIIPAQPDILIKGLLIDLFI